MPHPLFIAAMHADQQLTNVIAAHTNSRRNRWTMTAADLQIPEIRAAYLTKLAADDLWLAEMRRSRREVSR